MTEEPSESEIKINDHATIPIKWVAAIVISSISLVVSIVHWGSRVESKADHASAKAANLESTVRDIQSDVKTIRESTIRIEARMGIPPSYFIRSREDRKPDER